jgi:hypothetical protein
MTIATGADAAYFPALVNLVGSIHYWMPSTGVAVFNLGLDAPRLNDIAGWRNCHLHWAATGIPLEVELRGARRRCRHLRDLKKYAWKPAALVEAVERYGSVLWLDAGSDLRGRIASVERILGEDGCFLVKGQDLDMTAKLHGRCPRHFGFDRRDFAGKPSFAGNTQGYVRGSDAALKILLPMYEAACEKGCIAPFGSSLRNHRYDQSILSILAYSCGLDLKDHTHLLAADRHQLDPDPRKPSARPIFTARGSSADYVGYLRR